MNMSDIDKLLESTQYKAPEGFTHNVMQKIYYNAERKTAVNRYYRRAGLSLIAASLVTLFLNMTPLMDQLIQARTNTLRFSESTVNYTRTANSIEYITLKIESVAFKPYRFLAEQLNKEDHPHE